MNDKESSGSITLEEALQIMYLRHGRADLDAKLEEVFGTSDLNSGMTLNLTKFLSCLHQHQVGASIGCQFEARGLRGGG
jgi:calmodulin